jgi:hypothetical protein
MATKLANIRNTHYISALTFDKVRDVIQQHNLPIAVVRDTGGIEKLVFNPDPQKRFLILKVLGDDYLNFKMTERKYAFNSKYPLS